MSTEYGTLLPFPVLKADECNVGGGDSVLETRLETDLETEFETFYAAYAFQKTLRPPPTYYYYGDKDKLGRDD